MSRSQQIGLSKSKYLAGLQCEKRLWLEIYHPELKPNLTASQERVFAGGTAVGEVARERFPGGRLVQAPFYDLPGSVRENWPATWHNAASSSGTATSTPSR